MEEGDEDGQRILGTGVCTVCMPRVPKVPRVPRMARQPKQPSGSSILLDGRLAGGGKPNSVGGPQEAGFFFWVASWRSCLKACRAIIVQETVVQLTACSSMGWT